jgi:hypothetical protein
MKVASQLILVFLLTEGAILGIVAWVIFRKARARLARYYRTTGEVIEIKTDNDSVKTPMIRYTTNRGEVQIFQSGYGSSNWKIEVGDRIEIMADPDDPTQAEVVGFMAQWALPTFLGGTAVWSIICAPIIYWFMRTQIQ